MSHLVPTILVTGITSFLGRNFLRQFRDHFNFVCLVRRTSKVEDLGLSESQFLFFEDSDLEEKIKNIGADVFVNLMAAYNCDESTEDGIDNILLGNLKYPLLILNHFLNSGGKRVLNIGSYWQHHNDSELGGNCLYAQSKTLFENFLKLKTDELGLTSISLFLFDNYGENDERGKILNILKNNPPKTLDMTDGTQKINILHISDVASAIGTGILRILDNKRSIYESFYVRSDQAITLRSLIELFLSMSGQETVINWGKKKNGPKSFKVLPNLLETLPGWERKISLEDGLLMFIQDKQ